MKRLDRYLLGGFLELLGLTFLALVLLHGVLDAFDHLARLLEQNAATGRGWAEALWGAALACLVRAGLLVPRFAALPVALAGMLAASRLTRQGEAVAIQAAGVSLRRAFRGPLVAALLAGLAVLAYQEWAVPRLALLDHYYRHAVFGVAEKFRDPLSVRVSETADGRVQTVVNAERFDPETGRIEGFSAELFGARDGLADGTGISARAAVWEPGGGAAPGAWRLEDGLAARARPERVELAPLGRLATTATPARLTMERLGPDALGLRELARFSALRAAQAELWSRLAALLTPLIVLLLVLPPLLKRGGLPGAGGVGMTLGFALGLMATFGLTFAGEYAGALAAAGTLAVALVALPQLVAGAAGAWLYGRWMDG